MFVRVMHIMTMCRLPNANEFDDHVEGVKAKRKLLSLRIPLF